MARASTSRVAVRASQSQPKPSQSQGARRGARRGLPEEDDDDDDDDGAAEDAPVEMDSEPEATQEPRRGENNEPVSLLVRHCHFLRRY